jgi:hypothetical protein
VEGRSKILENDSLAYIGEERGLTVEMLCEYELDASLRRCGTTLMIETPSAEVGMSTKG